MPLILPILLALAVAAFSSAAASPPYSLVRAFPALSLTAPIHLTPANDGSGRLFVAEKSGLIRVFQPTGADTGGIFLDLREKVLSFRPETGLLGLAFHPRFAENGRFFVHYSGRSFRTVLAEYRAAPPDAMRADASESILLTVPQPTDSHNGGQIEFGADGYLYMGLGDGGGPEERYDHGQDLTTLLGTILRLDVDGARIGIPPDNPFVGNDQGWREEIWAYGFRNPWRFSFDSGSGLLWVGDVGEKEREEIDRVERGGNYGWGRMEGTRCRDPAGCGDTGLIPPVLEYGRDQGSAVIGGYVYQGSRRPELVGAYLFGDFGSRQIWSLRREGDGWQSEWLAVAADHIAAFGRDAEGEVYVLALNGAIYRLAPAAERPGPPAQLSETGIFADMAAQVPADGVVPYQVSTLR